MAGMTWKQFKELVDKKLAKIGKDEEIPICYIEVDPPDLGMIVVGKNSAGHLVVCTVV